MKIPAAVFATILAASGFAHADDCFKTSIVSPTPFMGNSGEIFKITDGSAWEVKYEYEYLYEYYPTVLLCPGRGKMIVKKKSLNIAAVSSPNRSPARTPTQPVRGNGKWEVFEETNLKGNISGTVKAGSIFKTTSGNVYEVTGLTLQLVLELQPDVMVLRNGDEYKLVVKGFDEPLICRKLN